MTLIEGCLNSAFLLFFVIALLVVVATFRPKRISQGW
jgi:hypothetical protein